MRVNFASVQPTDIINAFCLVAFFTVTFVAFV